MDVNTILNNNLFQITSIFHVINMNFPLIKMFKVKNIGCLCNQKFEREICFTGFIKKIKKF